ncbi:hypothetical protein KY312_04635 [Candidatus Woesearchaeota archaeon]|nr:hypothetical protein [Candidatus Woesearchaeota archaeon]
MAKEKTSTKRKSTKAPKDKYFWVIDGTVIRSVKELVDAIDTMDYNIFQHHVNDARNDFAAWVENVLNLENLARDLRTTTNKDRAVITVLRHLIK